LKPSLAKFSLAAFIAASCVLSTGASAQSDDKRALAVRLAQIQHKTDGAAIAEQLVNSAVQPLLAGWSQRLDETVPPARQKEVRDKLDVELKKFADATQKAIEAQVAKSAEAALTPIFVEKLTEDEMKTVIAWLESPVSAKFQSLGPQATNAWAQSIIDATKASVENSAKTFDAAANRIVSAAASAPPSGAAAPAKK
jgi:hypothetical protein